MKDTLLFTCCATAPEFSAVLQSPLWPGTMLHGRYEVMRLLTTTTLNDVYLVYDYTTQASAVLKLAHCDARFCDTRCFQYMVLTYEYLMLQRFTAHNIPVPQPLEHFIFAGRPCLAMQYVDGITLEQRHARGELSANVAVQAIAHTATLAHRVHQLGYVIHDLKPSNIMLTPTGIVLLDLGASHRRMDNTSHIAVVLGTPHYMSPEQHRG